MSNLQKEETQNKKNVPSTKTSKKKKLGQTSWDLNWFTAIITFAVGIIIWFIPAPAGLDIQAWHLFAIFAATIVGLIAKPLPMGAVAITAITMTVITGTLPLRDALSGFSNSTIWMIVMAFFISRGFIKTGLGRRVAFFFVKHFGKKTLGLGYSMAATDLVLSPAMPSTTARAGGVVWPIILSLSRAYGSRPDDGTANKMGAWLHVTEAQCNAITCAMFVTAMAANPLCVQLAQSTVGIDITWGGWAIAALIPGIVSLIVIPLVTYKLCPPEIKETPSAHEFAQKNLDELGSVSNQEKIMIAVFFLILILWIGGTSWGISATTTAFIGLVVLLFTGVLSWDDVKKETGAWNTLIWFAALVMMATQLNTLGFIPWLSNGVAGSISGLPWQPALIILALVYFFSHYLFASATAHVSAMYGAFLAVAVAAGAPAMLAALLLGYISSLYDSLTHYAGGPSPVLFGAGYVSQGKWWTVGLVCGLINLVIWGVIGGAWWKVLGLW